MVSRGHFILVAVALLLASMAGLVWIATRSDGGEPRPDVELLASTPTPIPASSPTPVPPRWEAERWQKGFAFWDRAAPFGSPESFQALRRLRDVGANTVSPVVTWYVAGPHDPHLHRGKGTPNEDELMAAVDEARRQGLQVVLRIHVDCEDGSWRARIDPYDKDAFFAAYGTVLTYYARLAEEHQVAGMVIGAELVGLTSPANTLSWRSLIARVRQQFSGFLTYSAQWGSAPPSSPTDPYREFQQIEFWDDLDYLGISAYFELAEGSQPSPPASELLARWEEWRKLQIEPLQARYGKPLLFTEVGYPSSGEAAHHPWGGGGYGAVNLQLQAELYSALFQSWSGVPWFRGAYFWFWPTGDYGVGPTSSDYPPAGKPAEEVVQRWYRWLDDMERGGM